jgi:hypothetical protein
MNKYEFLQAPVSGISGLGKGPQLLPIRALLAVEISTQY